MKNGCLSSRGTRDLRFVMRRMIVFNNDVCKMLIKIQNVEVSDTTGDDSSNAVKYIIAIALNNFKIQN